MESLETAFGRLRVSYPGQSVFCGQELVGGPGTLGGAGPTSHVPSVSDTFIENRERVQPDDVNNNGSAHGGNVVKWMDEVGAMSAMRHAGATCVTARIDGLDFERPIPQGEICVIESYAYAVGRSSIRVRLRAFREGPRTGEREQTTDSYFVFVAVNEEMRPVPVPELDVETERCQELQEDALAGEPGR